MTVQEKPRFAQCFNRLAVALRLPANEADSSMQRVYWDALSDLPVEAIEDAARELAADSQWFPKTSEWRDVAVKAKHGRMLKAALPEPRANPWQSECETCDDTGWEALDCDGSSQCGRTKEHGKHAYVIHCACLATNRTYQRKQAEQSERARQRHKASQGD